MAIPMDLEVSRRNRCPASFCPKAKLCARSPARAQFAFVPVVPSHPHAPGFHSPRACEATHSRAASRCRWCWRASRGRTVVLDLGVRSRPGRCHQHPCRQTRLTLPCPQTFTCRCSPSLAGFSLFVCTLHRYVIATHPFCLPGGERPSPRTTLRNPCPLAAARTHPGTPWHHT